MSSRGRSSRSSGPRSPGTPSSTPTSTTSTPGWKSGGTGTKPCVTPGASTRATRTATASARCTSTRWRASGPCCAPGSGPTAASRRRSCRSTSPSSGSCTTPGAGVISTALVGDRSGPLATGDRGEPVGRGHEPVPRLAAGRDDGVVALPDAMAELVLPQVLPDVLDRVQLGRVGRERQEGEVLGDGKVAGAVPTGAVEHDHRVRAGRDVVADLRQVQAGGLGVGVGQDQRGTDGPLGADRAEQVGPGVAAVARRPGAGAAPRPHPGQGALLADAGLVLEPDLDRLAAGVLGQRSRHQIGEAFLNAAC